MQVCDMYEAEREAGRITPEKEQIAYERYVEILGDPTLNISTGLTEELEFEDFVMRFGHYGWLPETAEERFCYRNYKVINTVPAIRGTARWCRVPVFTFGGKDGKQLMESELSMKYPTVPEVIFQDMLASHINYGEEADPTMREVYSGKVISVVLDCDEHFDPLEYFRYVWFAVETDPAAMTVTVYGKEDAIRIFHEKMQEVEYEIIS